MFNAYCAIFFVFVYMYILSHKSYYLHKTTFSPIIGYIYFVSLSMTFSRWLVSFVLSICALALFWSVVHAQSSGIPADFFSTLLWDNFWYITQNISVKSINSGSVTFESPVLLDEGGDDIKRYIMIYGTYPLSQLLAWWSSVSINDFKQKTFTFTWFSSTKFTMDLMTSDGVLANQIYYVTVRPIDDDGKEGQVSGPDVCFRLQDGKTGLGTSCSTWWTGTVHNSAGANMALANVSHTRNGNNITLRWTAVTWAPKVDIFLLNNTTQQATKLVTKNMTDETYTFPLTSQPPQVVRFIPVQTNGTQAGTQIDYTMRETLWTTTTPPTTPTKPGVPKVPTVWPKEDMLFILFLSIFVYGIVRFVRSRRKA